MTVDDRTRLNPHRKLEAVLGQQEADTLMSHLPPVTWHDVATKDDVRACEVALRSHIDGAVGGLNATIDGVATQLRSEMHVLGSDLRREFIEATNRQIKWLVTFAAGWTTVLLTLARFIP